MPDLLLELFSEEIPARMQARAADDLRRLVTDGLVAQGFLYEGARTFVTPRRLTLAVQGLPERGQDVREEKKGPRVGAPQAAIDGFLRSAGLASIDQATVQSDPKKGDSYIAVIERPGRATAEVLAELLPGVIRAFPWPKSMRWGASSGPEGKAYAAGTGAGASTLRWVRPLRSILCTFATEHDEPEIIRFTVGDVTSSNVTYGHRFMSNGQPITVKRLDDYLASLEAAKVMADPARRKETLLHEARQLCFAQGLELVEDEALADEVAGLVEWPVPLMGGFEEEFLSVPPEAVRLTIRANQKCFVVQGKDGKLAPRFVATANVEASDGGATIIAGNARVIRARLSDARFFWETDRKVKLMDRLEKLKSVRFHEKLGTQHERVERIAALAEEIAPLVRADPKLARQAALLAKADLGTEMVGEFPELQGLMGRYYAALEGYPPEVCAAVEEHYKPQGPSDVVPTNPVSIAVALADKLDTLVGFWAIDEKPTGSKDPYALRRAALGVIRLVVENGIECKIADLILSTNYHLYQTLSYADNLTFLYQNDGVLEDKLIAARFINERPEMNFPSVFPDRQSIVDKWILSNSWMGSNLWPITKMEYNDRKKEIFIDGTFRPTKFLVYNLVSFFHDRLKVMLREQGARHDLVDAVLGAGAPSPLGEGGRRSLTDEGESLTDAEVLPHPSASGSHLPPGGKAGSAAANDDLLSIVNRVNALSAFLSTDDGRTLLAGYRRAANILRAEEKKDGDGAFEAAVDAAALREPEEQALHAALRTRQAEVETAVAAEDFTAAMAAMAQLRAPVDAFFEAILVNDADPAIRANRLRLLALLRRVTATIADFGKVSG